MTFEVLRFETLRATGEVAVLELQGTFDGGTPPARPRLLVEGADAAQEIPAVGAVVSDPWEAAFAVPADVITDAGTAFSLVTGRGPLIALPSPTAPGEAGEDRLLELARDANELRRRAERAARRADAAETERDGLAEQLAAAERRVLRADEQREELRTEADAAEREAAQLRETGDELRDETEDLRSRIVLLEDELRLARRELRDLRARAESMRRDRRTVDSVRRRNGAPAPAPLPSSPAPADPVPVASEPSGEATGEAAPAAAPRPRRAVPGVIGAPELDEEEVVDPARIGARLIQPSETRPGGQAVTPAGVAAATALVVIIVALVAVLLGAGPLQI